MVLVMLEGGVQRFIGEGLKTPQDRVVSAPAEARHLLVAYSKSHKRGLIEIEGKPGLGSRCVFVNQPPVNADDLERTFFEVVSFLGIQRKDLPRDFAVNH